MRVLVIGNGQLGSALAATAKALGDELMVTAGTGWDVSDPVQVELTVKGFAPRQIFHTAALTKVNYCEERPDLASLVNGRGTANVAAGAFAVGAELAYFSTDYVFDGTAKSVVTEGSETHPLNAYGASKLEGESHVLGYSGGRIVRTSGVFGPRLDGSERNFFRAIFEKLTQTDGSIEVVDDQFTCVTYAPHLAAMTLELLPDLPKIVHLTSAGADSWCGWARQLALVAGYDPGRIVPVPTDPSSPVRRPAYSVLGSQYERVNRIIGQYPARNGISEYVRLLKGRL